MTYDGGVRDFGRTMKAYFVSNILRIAAFPTQESSKLWNCNVMTCDVS